MRGIPRRSPDRVRSPISRPPWIAHPAALLLSRRGSPGYEGRVSGQAAVAATKRRDPGRSGTLKRSDPRSPITGDTAEGAGSREKPFRLHLLRSHSYSAFPNPRRGAGVVDRGGLENRCTLAYRGFESHPLRQPVSQDQISSGEDGGESEPDTFPPSAGCAAEDRREGGMRTHGVGLFAGAARYGCDGTERPRSAA